ncbi:hypothetical protein HHK36_027418 [Tetracentron sinense]|uniref:Protein TILLER ANGLE CONTROL 1 n=1 Tax=Tetracentron sinense TaxID=13715 RepID=A0A834YHH5_TETSI|nr:hypothetical protein HHK36_027418 [Tetracentron sinense]
MKIFNYVHRKFLQKVDSSTISQRKDGFAQDAKKPKTVTNEADTAALLEPVNLVDVLDGWKDGILTIGTFGFDHVKASQELPEEYSVKEEEHSVTEDEGDDLEDEELQPLVVKAFKQEFEKVFSSNPDADVPKPHLLTTVDDTPLFRFLESPKVKFDSENGKKKKKGERTTLADLFSADLDVSGKSDSDELPPDSGKKPALRTKHGLSFAKKFVSRKGEDSHPIRKLHQMMRKMLKKKIHPELEGKIHGMAGSEEISDNVLGEVSHILSVNGGTNELVSLLQDAVFST